jgi:hypothetical protein
VLLVFLLVPVFASCAESVSTQVVPIAQQLPEREEARYLVLDAKGAQQGSAVLTIAPEGDHVRLGLAYDFGQGRTDTSSLLVRRDSMKPTRTERIVVDGDRRYVSQAEYGEKVVVALDDGRRPRRREAAVSESAYDNVESLFLWRTIDHSVGREVRYVNVIIDPKRGTISRALGTVEVLRREEVRLPSGTVQAWRVQFRSAGVTNTAWYRADASKALVRYEITRGPTLVLDTMSK